MIKKSSIILLFFLLFYIQNVSTVDAEEINNLKDCLEQDEDCLQENEIPSEENNDEDVMITEKDGLGSSLFMNILKMIFALILILALIFFLAKLWNRKNNKLQQSNILENLGGIPLGQNKSIQIVRIGNHFYVMGVGEDVQLLMEITDENIVDEFIQYGKESEDFKTVFQNMVHKVKDTHREESGNESFVSTLSDEIEQMKQHRKTIIDNKDKKDDQHE